MQEAVNLNFSSLNALIFQNKTMNREKKKFPENSGSASAWIKKSIIHHCMTNANHLIFKKLSKYCTMKNSKISIFSCYCAFTVHCLGKLQAFSDLQLLTTLPITK